MIDISKLKHTWHSEWSPLHRYESGDIVRWKNSSYVCIKDIPLEYVASQSAMVSTNLYYGFTPGIYVKTKDPSDSSYWLQFAPGTRYNGVWARNRQYEVGDTVNLAGDVYVCIKSSGGINNLYPEINTDYFTKIFQTADRDRRLFPVSHINEQPLGWKYNKGDTFNGQQPYQYGPNFIDAEGLAYTGGYFGTGYGGRGGAENGVRHTHMQSAGFTYVEWFKSTDNGGTGRLVTPDGKAPKVIQTLYAGASNSYWLMNNGEVYASGENSWGKLGVNDTTTRYYTVKVDATDTTDWLGNFIPYSFRNSKIVKIASSGSGSTDSTHANFALDDLGGVWAWGYNGTGGLGLGSSAITNSVAGGNLYQNNSSIYRPRRLPTSFFDNRKIVDIMSTGGSRPRTYALDIDGNLWVWGNEYHGELGLGTRNASDGWSYRVVPQMVPVNWSRYGGIKKIMQSGNANGQQRIAVLDGQGKLWVAGYWNGSTGNGQSLVAQGDWTGSGAYENVNGRIQSFHRLEKGWFRDHDIDNFWVHGDTDCWTLFLREKGTGITYSLGHNIYGILGQNSNHQYGYGGGTYFYPEPGRVEGPLNVVKTINTHTGAPSSTGSPYQFMTIIMLCDDGTAWGQGRNSYGSLGINYSGMGYYDQTKNAYTTNGNSYQLIEQSVSPGNGFTNIHAWGTGQRDCAMIFNEAGQMQISGADGDNDAGYDYWQGHWWGLHYYQSTTSNPGNYHRYHFHSYPQG